MATLASDLPLLTTARQKNGQNRGWSHLADAELMSHEFYQFWINVDDQMQGFSSTTRSPLEEIASLSALGR
jgi:hypothetical protein